jgi:hypothetical protein
MRAIVEYGRVVSSSRRLVVSSSRRLVVSSSRRLVVSHSFGLSARQLLK